MDWTLIPNCAVRISSSVKDFIQKSETFLIKIQAFFRISSRKSATCSARGSTVSTYGKQQLAPCYVMLTFSMVPVMGATAPPCGPDPLTPARYFGTGTETWALPSCKIRRSNQLQPSLPSQIISVLYVFTFEFLQVPTEFLLIL